MSKKPDVDLPYIREALSRPQGYLEARLQGILRKYYWSYTEAKATNKNYRRAREMVTKFVGDLLWSGKVALSTGPDTLFLDNNHERKTYAERYPVSQVIIHHSSTNPDVSLQELNAHGFLERGLYVQHFSSGNSRHGMPIFSGHRFENSSVGAPDTDVFFAYHHVVRPNGTRVRLLKDSDIGWHSGIWDINLLSVGICFLGDFSNGRPTSQAVRAVNEIIEQHYQGAIIKGHREVVDTVCPGNEFLGERGWRESLVKRTA